ncbi:Branched-chain amino acid transport system permease protein LivM (TC 3.A.1.4.1) [plant metagenome]|uniref:Branched-chain amino acid transport system permease protein LivM (TC 3.A.1.4.1) n=1 Tax=plant metagenome TaxID=1297885 RepID=A0A484QZG2_9ZZZZ
MLSKKDSPPAPRGTLVGQWLPWALLAALAAFPLVATALGLDYYVGFVRRMLIIMMAAASLNFILGYGGLVALGHAGFIGVGAYTVVALADGGAESAWHAWAMALAVSAAVSALIGLVALRTRGVYFIMITLAFAEMLHYLAVSVRTYGGDDGYSLYSPLTMGAWLDGLAHGFYWVVLALAALVFALGSRLANSRFGHALVGARDNETRMEAMGFPVFRLRLVAFAGAGAVAGLAGALLAVNNSFVSPSIMGWTQSAILIVMVVIGGIGNRWGGVIGAGLWLTLEECLKGWTDYWHAPLGLLLILIVFFAPRGIAALFTPKGAQP